MSENIDRRSFIIWYLLTLYAVMILLLGIALFFLLPSVYGLLAILASILMLAIGYAIGRNISGEAKKKLFPALLRQSFILAGATGVGFIFFFWNLNAYIVGSILLLVAVTAGSISYLKGH